MILRFAPSTDSMKLDFDVNSNVNHAPVHFSPYHDWMEQVLIFVADDMDNIQFFVCVKKLQMLVAEKAISLAS